MLDEIYDGLTLRIAPPPPRIEPLTGAGVVLNVRHEIKPGFIAGIVVEVFGLAVRVAVGRMRVQVAPVDAIGIVICGEHFQRIAESRALDLWMAYHETQPRRAGHLFS